MARGDPADMAARRRSGAARSEGILRSAYLAKRIGIALRESRLALDLSQGTAAGRAGISQTYWSALERCGAASASLETLAVSAAAVESQLATFLQASPGADMPRDIAHLRGQDAIVRCARRGGWSASIEDAIDPAAFRSRSIDVRLDRGRTEIAVVELVDLLADAGAALRGLADKVNATKRVEPDRRVSGLLVLRATRRNRMLVRDLEEVFRSRFPAPPGTWIAALARADRPMPRGDGIIWIRVDGSGLFAARASARPRDDPVRGRASARPPDRAALKG